MSPLGLSMPAVLCRFPSVDVHDCGMGVIEKRLVGGYTRYLARGWAELPSCCRPWYIAASVDRWTYRDYEGSVYVNI
jgi:hypothetical protein